MMGSTIRVVCCLIVLFAFIFPADASSSAEKRLALVVGNASYRAQKLEIAANDAGFIAGKLRTAGFEVTQTRDLDSESLKRTFSDFVGKVRDAGPDAVAVVYFSGYALQLQGENYLLPVDVDTDVADVSDLPRLAVRVSDLTRALSPLQGGLIILDAARRNPFLLSGQPPAAGLAWLETWPNVLVAFNAAPGMVSPDSKNDGGYGSYAQAIAEMMGEENVTLTDAFVRVRIRVNEMTRGEQIPWHNSGIGSQLALFGRVAGTLKRSESQDIGRLRSRPMSGLSAQDGYFAAIQRDTLDSYADYLADHWRDPTATRIRALLAVRREMLVWQRTCRAGVPEAFWSYLERYPEGPHAGEARRILQKLGASAVPPPAFKKLEYDIPSPLPGEAAYLVSPSFGFEPPPPTPAGLLGPVVESTRTPSAPQENVHQALASGTRGTAVQSNSSMGKATIVDEIENASPPSQRSNAKQIGSPNSEGSVAKASAAVPPTVGMPYWAYADVASAPPNAYLTNGSVSRFPEWAMFGLLSPSSDPAFTGAVVPPASSDANGLPDQEANMSLTALRPSLSEPQTQLSATPPVRIPLPVARRTALAPLQGMPKRPLLSRQSQPTSSLRQAVPPNRQAVPPNR
ncbi:hypothetical protein AYJ54_21345 [Bradyrhizobium centrolobii]|uniref:Peptidase C14 caspase domain-containing protein n=1 Tax=Bradyrhizobium centrolobii TaxID=1505087 RepID=A0A176YHT5_9BRAD|nr:caspase family protein [Bradyrhizobium centrolobii]OAF06212.1 hypothetical protein AYJ54_21345 [Bradyrhizobium centrolobii]